MIEVKICVRKKLETFSGSRHGSIASLDGIQMQPSPVPQSTYYEQQQQQQMQQRPYSAQQPGSQTGSAVRGNFVYDEICS